MNFLLEINVHCSCQIYHTVNVAIIEMIEKAITAMLDVLLKRATMFVDQVEVCGQTV